MTDSTAPCGTPDHSSNPGHSADPGDSDPTSTPAPLIGVVDGVDGVYLVASAEPAVVFSSLARVCVPAFSDTCTVDIVEHERAAYRISYPLTTHTATSAAHRTARFGHLAEHRHDTCHRVSTRFASLPTTNAAAYFGVITHTWRHHAPTATDAAHAQLLTDHAVAAITNERRTDAAEHPASTEQPMPVTPPAGRPAPRIPDAADDVVAPDHRAAPDRSVRV